LLNIQNHLIYGSYIPGRYKEFFVHDPKTRLILCLPFQDRIVHQAICNVINPLFEKSFIYDSYACRKGKGTLAAVNRCEKFLNGRMKKGKTYCLKMDIQKYFYSIDHGMLRKLITKKIRCRETMNLLDIIINSTDDPGIPVGNLTSQLFANIYLNELDHYAKDELKIKHYVRYMDDVIILENDKNKLWNYLKQLTEKITALKLVLNKKTVVFDTAAGIDFLGYRQFPTTRILRKRVMTKNYRKFNKFAKSNIDTVTIKQSANSLLGQCRHCNSLKVINKIKNIIGVESWEQMFSN